MAKEIKQTTRVKSTATNKVATTKTKKGGTTMNIGQAMQQLMIDYNNYQEYRKEHNQAYNFASKQQIQDFAKKLTKEEQEYLIKSYLIQRKLHKKLADYILNEYLLNNAYGREEVHPSELQPDESSAKKLEQRIQQEYKSAKDATKKTKRAVNKAALEQQDTDWISEPYTVLTLEDDIWTEYETFPCRRLALETAKQLEQDGFAVKVEKYFK